MLLGNRNAVIYGGGGAIGGAFAREGARGFLAGLDEVGEEIRAPRGADEAAQLDALGNEAAEEHAGEVAEKAGASTSLSTPSRSGTCS